MKERSENGDTLDVATSNSPGHPGLLGDVFLRSPQATSTLHRLYTFRQTSSRIDERL